MVALEDTLTMWRVRHLFFMISMILKSGGPMRFLLGQGEFRNTLQSEGLEQFRQRVKRACHEYEIGYQMVRSDEDPAAVLTALLSARTMKAR